MYIQLVPTGHYQRQTAPHTCWPWRPSLRGNRDTQICGSKQVLVYVMWEDVQLVPTCHCQRRTARHTCCGATDRMHHIRQDDSDSYNVWCGSAKQEITTHGTAHHACLLKPRVKLGAATQQSVSPAAHLHTPRGACQRGMHTCCAGCAHWTWH